MARGCRRVADSAAPIDDRIKDRDRIEIGIDIGSVNYDRVVVGCDDLIFVCLAARGLINHHRTSRDVRKANPARPTLMRRCPVPSSGGRKQRGVDLI